MVPVRMKSRMCGELEGFTGTLEEVSEVDLLSFYDDGLASRA